MTNPTNKNLIYLLFLLILPLSLLCQSGYSQGQKATIKVTIIPHRSNLGNEQAYKTFFTELAKETGFKFQWVGSKTYDDVILKIQTGAADIGYVGLFAYVDVQDSFDVLFQHP